MMYEPDGEAFSSPAYKVHNEGDVAWHVLGWETTPSGDGYPERTGLVVANMVGDDRHHAFERHELLPIEEGSYCGSCGQFHCHMERYEEPL